MIKNILLVVAYIIGGILGQVIASQPAQEENEISAYRLHQLPRQEGELEKAHKFIKQLQDNEDKSKLLSIAIEARKLVYAYDPEFHPLTAKERCMLQDKAAQKALKLDYEGEERINSEREKREAFSTLINLLLSKLPQVSSP
jgi:hypothetical protein